MLCFRTHQGHNRVSSCPHRRSGQPETSTYSRVLSAPGAIETSVLGTRRPRAAYYVVASGNYHRARSGHWLPARSSGQPAAGTLCQPRSAGTLGRPPAGTPGRPPAARPASRVLCGFTDRYGKEIAKVVRAGAATPEFRCSAWRRGLPARRGGVWTRSRSRALRRRLGRGGHGRRSPCPGGAGAYW